MSPFETLWAARCCEWFAPCVCCGAFAHCHSSGNFISWTLARFLETPADAVNVQYATWRLFVILWHQSCFLDGEIFPCMSIHGFEAQRSPFIYMLGQDWRYLFGSGYMVFFQPLKPLHGRLCCSFWSWWSLVPWQSSAVASLWVGFLWG